MVEVGAAIIKKDGRILIAQRNKNKAEGLKWEFPGGKIEDNETVEEFLKREIQEELCIDIQIHDFFGESIYNCSKNSIKLIVFYGEWISGELKAIEHEKIQWVTVDELKHYDFAPADIPIVDKLRRGNFSGI